MNLSFSFLNKLAVVISPVAELKQKKKIHDYRQQVCGGDYIFERLNEGTIGYMTGVGKRVKACDRIILREGCESYQYQVEEIDYYSAPSDMWTALLKQIPND
ncbi:hypothetical protein [Nostoc sp. 'Lobaria pulmonaria (5183) cyanobiont']|uniref:hypothetical protein n=1 Tax=Nostoc sp. 'Lobaria pulmonaria (5183) cyanobiont' TaxID=1618022 RepID=UPI000D0C6CEE|nr:hypothetical protein [Nostoc sp. 'Lobaria pulmonaria (5183) cyanobiont']AVH71814.1 hypothetical protein NLP_3253 [Nostoc sp. 'Lobaria pulmonaria (5183) cyanobiont']